MESGKEIARGLFVARRDGSEVFDDVEEPFDQVALGVKREVAVALCLAVGFWRDNRRDGARFEAFDEGVGVIGLVGEQSLRLDLRGQRLGLRDVMGLAAGQADDQGIAERIDDGVDFRREPAARPSTSSGGLWLLRAPFFARSRAVLMRPDNGRVDHRVFVVGIIRHGLEKILPDTAHSPARKALVDILPVAEALRQIAPWRARAEFPDYGLNE